jgi:PAS domain S-box-containing protein
MFDKEAVRSSWPHWHFDLSSFGGRDRVRYPLGEGVLFLGIKPFGAEKIPIDISATPSVNPRQDRGLLRPLRGSSPALLVSVGCEGKIDLLNEAATGVFGYRGMSLIGQPVEMLLPRRMQDSFRDLVQIWYLTDRLSAASFEWESRGMHSDGREFPVVIGFDPFEIDIRISDATAHKVALQIPEVVVSQRPSHRRAERTDLINYSAEQLYAAQKEHPIASATPEGNRGRLWWMHHIRQALYRRKAVDKVDFGTFLRAFAPGFVASHMGTSDQVSLWISADSILLPTATAVLCALIVNELLSNAMTHAFASHSSGDVSIRFERESDVTLLLAVSDNGFGMPVEMYGREGWGVGLGLIAVLVHQLGGSVNLPVDTTEFAVRFPVSYGTA